MGPTQTRVTVNTNLEFEAGSRHLWPCNLSQASWPSGPAKSGQVSAAAGGGLIGRLPKLPDRAQAARPLAPLPLLPCPRLPDRGLRTERIQPAPAGTRPSPARCRAALASARVPSLAPQQPPSARRPGGSEDGGPVRGLGRRAARSTVTSRRAGPAGPCRPESANQMAPALGCFRARSPPAVATETWSIFWPPEIPVSLSAAGSPGVAGALCLVLPRTESLPSRP